MNGVELLAPAGNFETALAAFEAGADAVYCGLTEFSARAFADNFTLDDLKNLIRLSRKTGRKVYVTFNTVIDEDAREDALEQLSQLDEIGPDGLIVQDIGVARVCRRHFPSLALHASTQMVAHNLEGVLALRDLGFRRVVLARELSLEEITSIARRCGDVELECFIHGALCYSVSGLCLFGAMEKGRSGNRGMCPYCCRLPYEDNEGRKTQAFSMKDLRLGEDVRKLVSAGVASLKIEGRMKSALYVASVTRYYRQILGVRNDERQIAAEETVRRNVTVADLETVFSRRTTELYFNAPPGPNGLASDRSGGVVSPIDPDSLGHVGTEIGVVKRVTKDRDGLSWLRFHTARALEKHDGLQFEAMAEGRHVGMGIVEMRQAISRRPVFEVSAGTDVEVLVPDDASDLVKALTPGTKIYCSMSNAVKRMFPTTGFRPSDCAGVRELDVEVTLAKDGLSAKARTGDDCSCDVRLAADLQSAKSPERTIEGVRKAFSKLGDTDYRLGGLTVNDEDKRFAPMSLLNDLRRDLVERLDEACDKVRRAKCAAALADEPTLGKTFGDRGDLPKKVVKIRAGQTIPPGTWDEIVVAINANTPESLVPEASSRSIRLALPVYTVEPLFNKLRHTVKRFLREGYARWEASDLATLRMLRGLGVEDVSADWTLYAFNAQALAALEERGVCRFVASPENNRENLQYLAESGANIEFLAQQSTPLFISLTQPRAQPSNLAVFQRDEIWVTTKPAPRCFDLPAGVAVRLDLSWDPD